MIRASGHARRTSTAARSPSSVWLGGIRTSTMPRSGRCSSIAATNDGPSPTEPTTSWPASASSSWSPSRSSRESSATTTLTRRHRDPRDQRRSDRPRASRPRGCRRRPRPAAAARPARSPLAGWAPPTPSSSTRTSTSRFAGQDGHRGAGGAAVLGDVGERLGDHEVDGGLDVRRQLRGHVDARLDRDDAARGHLLERGREAAVDQQRRRDAADSDRSSSTVSRAWASASSMVARGPLGVVGHLPLGAAQVHGQPDQPLLRAVVDVALEAAQRLRLGHPGGVAAALDPGAPGPAARPGC